MLYDLYMYIVLHYNWFYYLLEVAICGVQGWGVGLGVGVGKGGERVCIEEEWEINGSCIASVYEYGIGAIHCFLSYLVKSSKNQFGHMNFGTVLKSTVLVQTIVFMVRSHLTAARD